MPKETGDDLTELRPCATNNGHCGSWRDAPKGLLSNFATVRAKLLSGFAAEKARALLDTVMRGRIAFRPIGKRPLRAHRADRVRPCGDSGDSETARFTRYGHVPNGSDTFFFHVAENAGNPKETATSSLTRCSDPGLPGRVCVSAQSSANTDARLSDVAWSRHRPRADTVSTDSRCSGCGGRWLIATYWG